MSVNRYGVLLAVFAVLAGSLGAPPVVHAQSGADAADEGLPLEPARWARFTTSEGTWLSLDVSPDGQSIAFDMLGDLYTIPIAGGTATRITDGIAHDMQPRFSPDGQHIVFVSDRSGDDNVWTVRADGSDPRQITDDGGVVSGFLSPEWTPDGNYIVVSRSRLGGGNEKLWLYHIKGGTGIADDAGVRRDAHHGRSLRCGRAVRVVRPALRRMALQCLPTTIPGRRVRP